MRICYVLLSPTFGMHQYTADLGNRMVKAGHEVHLVTTTHTPRDRYAPSVEIHTPVETTNTGFSWEVLSIPAFRRALQAIRQVNPDVVHFTGPHLWNVFLVQALRSQSVPICHTIHDLHPHAGAFYGRLLYLWNRSVRDNADQIVVHGEQYRDTLLAQGIIPFRVTYTPLMHLFLSHAQEQRLLQSPPTVRYEPWALFFARFEVYKGLPVLIEAARRIAPNTECSPSVILAGRGQLEKLGLGPVPPNVEVRNRLIDDQEAIDLFSHCSLVVLPYIEASQSALIAAAYFFRKPVIVTRTGALPEYVVPGETGWVIPPNNPQALADGLEKALADPDRLARMGNTGREWYEGQRQIEGKTLQEMYAELGDGARQRADGAIPSTVSTQSSGRAEA
jgi:glycosyltransferase involved in cell wall biosynthesis